MTDVFQRIHFMSNRSWTPEEISLIKKGFLAGKLVKTLASEVGRSTTAVNKFLSRAGIRNRRWTIEKSKRRSYKKDDSLFKVSNAILRRTYSSEIPADFGDIVEYLTKMGYVISKNNSEYEKILSGGNYTINNKPISEGKLLLLANRLRIENHQPIFSVPALIW